MNNSYLSIAIPTYNSSGYLLRLLKKIEKFNSVNEIVIQDDFSTGEEFKNINKIVKRFNKKKFEIKVLQNKKNLGAFLNKINAISNFIREYFNYIQKRIHWVRFNRKIITNKLDEIYIKIKIPYLKKLFNKNKKNVLKEINNINYYPNSFCHGDLTLSNMIIAKNKIYLIDFLKTYNDGIAQDLSKIYLLALSLD